MSLPRILVFSTVYPNSTQPGFGVFVKERMRRVAEHLPLVVVAPQPWFPGQSLIRRFKPHFRPEAPAFEIQDGIEVYHPRFLSVPGLFKWLDGWLLARCSLRCIRQLQHKFDFDLIDSHFGYPDGYAASLLADWLNKPFCITLRGSEVVHAKTPAKAKRLLQALNRADRVFGVSYSMLDFARQLGVNHNRLQRIANGIDLDKFQPADKAQARQQLGLPANAKVLVSVGWLTPNKGFQRVLACLPAVQASQQAPVHYLIIGGPSAGVSIEAELRQQAAELGLSDQVHFLGARPHAELASLLAAADLFVLATEREGWANVFLEAMACGLPVVTTQVGGNPEVVSQPEVGILVPFGDAEALTQAMIEGLQRVWDKGQILAYARDNGWPQRVKQLIAAFEQLSLEQPAR